MTYIESYDYILAEYLERGEDKEDAEVYAAEEAYEMADCNAYE